MPIGLHRPWAVNSNSSNCFAAGGPDPHTDWAVWGALRSGEPPFDPAAPEDVAVWSDLRLRSRCAHCGARISTCSTSLDRKGDD
jgi:hypothetical protein